MKFRKPENALNPLADETVVKQQILVREMRRRIMVGDFLPGTRLPVRQEIGREFGVSEFTVQRALDYLKRDGFIRAEPRQGIYVSDHLPHLSNYALLFPGDDPRSPSPSRFWSAVEHAAARLSRSSNYELTVYHGVDPTDRRLHRLMKDIESERLAGLIFAFHPWRLIGWPALEQRRVPHVIVTEQPDLPNAPVVYPDGDTFFTRAAEHLQKCGRRRVAVLANGRGASVAIERFEGAAPGWNLSVAPEMVQFTDWTHPRAVRAVTSLLMRGNRNERPDALILADDHLVEHATAALADAGIVPGEIEIVALCNFPEPPPSSLPVVRLGFDADAILRACVDRILDQRLGRAFELRTRIQALFEEEFIESRSGIGTALSRPAELSVSPV